MKTPLIIVAAVAAYVLAVWAMGFPYEPSHMASPRPDEPTSTVEAPAVSHAAVSNADLRRPGAWSVYGVDHRLHVALGGPAPDVDGPPSLHVAGRWTQTVVSSGDDGMTLDVSLLPSVISPPTLVPDGADLARPFTLVLGPGGAIDAVAFEPGVSPQARQVLRTLAATVQLQRDERRDWIRDEVDTSGWFEARYAASADGRRVERRKVDYDRLMTGDGPVDTETLDDFGVDGRTTFTLDGQGMPEAIDGTEDMTISLDAELGLLSSRLRYTWIRQRVGQGSVPALTMRRSEPLVTTLADPGDPSAHERQLAGDATFEGLLAELAGLGGEATDRQARAELLQVAMKLGALLRLDPSAAGRVGGILADPGAMTPEARGALIASLAHAATPESRAALLELSHVDDAQVRAESLFGLATMGNADQRTVDRLVEMADTTPDSPARLALGSSARTAAAGGASTDGAIEHLVAGWHDADDRSQRLTVLEALGNAGDAGALAVVQAAIAGKDGELRSAAVRALRFVPGPEAEGLIADALSGALPGLRGAAIEAIAHRPIDGWTTRLEAALQSEQDPDLRARLARMLDVESGG